MSKTKTKTKKKINHVINVFGHPYIVVRDLGRNGFETSGCFTELKDAKVWQKKKGIPKYKVLKQMKGWQKVL